MKANEIKIGGVYIAKVSGNLTQFRVDGIAEAATLYKGNGKWGYGVRYHATNLKTGQQTSFASAAKFRKVAVG